MTRMLLTDCSASSSGLQIFATPSRDAACVVRRRKNKEYLEKNLAEVQH